jgi:hypothetical protein
MSPSRFLNYFPMLLLGILMAWVVSHLVGKFVPAAETGTLILFVLFWLTGCAQIIVSDTRGVPDRSVFADPSKWSPQQLPAEFRFITRGMTVEDVVARTGAYTRITQSGLVLYDLPDGGALFLHTDGAGEAMSRVTGIQLWRAEYVTPVST